MYFLKNLFKKHNPSEYVYQNDKLIIEGRHTREVKTFIQFGVSATSYFFELNKRLLESTFNKNIPIFYISDDPFEAKHLLIPYIDKVFKQKIYHEKITSTIEEFDEKLQSTSHLFLTPEQNAYRLNEQQLVEFKEKFFYSLEKLQQFEFKNKYLIVISINTCNFSEEELNRVHSVVKQLKNKNVICITNMADYGTALNFKDNFFGENNTYDEYWVCNIGEGLEIYPFLNRVENLDFFNKLPHTLKHHLSKTSNSNFLKQCDKYFQNGNIKKYGSIVFWENLWFFEPF